jgi:arginine/lysine/ornithine decarboxylase
MGDQSKAPILDAIVEYRNRGDYTFGPPGHRQGRGVDQRVMDILGEGVFASDILSLNGLDDRRQSHKLLEQAQGLMAEAVGAEHAFFSTCGSSLSVKTAMLAVAGPGEKLLISRNAHKSVISGVIVNGTVPVWVQPKLDERRRMAHPPEPDDVRRALQDNPDAKGMVLITPTDWGTCADIAGVAAVCHEHGVPLIVDEAWGAHLPFHGDLPTWGMNAGADVVVTSVHKMGGAVEQSSVFHLQGDLVDPTVLKQREDLLGTTSATSLVYGSLDGWRRQMVEHGEELLGRVIRLAREARATLSELDGIELVGRQVVDEGLAFELDPLVFTLDVRGLGMTGYQFAEVARARHHVNLGAADACRVNARLTHSDDARTVALLVDTVTAIVEDHGGVETPPAVDFPSAEGLQLDTVMLPRDAFFGEVEQVPVEQAVGRVAAELVSPYPPGVPVLAPGELISRDAVDYLRSGLAAGMLLPDPADPELGTIRVVKQGS